MGVTDEKALGHTDTAVTARKIRPDMGNELSRIKMNGDNADDKANDDNENSLKRMAFSYGLLRSKLPRYTHSLQVFESLRQRPRIYCPRDVCIELGYDCF